MVDTKRTVIGIVPSFDEGAVISGGPDGIKRVYLRREYMESVAKVGAIPLIITPEMQLESIMELWDGVIISGGHDIDPAQYGEEPLPEIRLREPTDRFVWEREIIEACDEAQIPILGICYGLQRLNVHYGGSLIQDIPTELATSVEHDNAEHEVIFAEEFLGIPAGESRVVASRHHQALGRVADEVNVCATARDGVVEAARINGRHYGMQWHPESDETGAHVYRIFIEECMHLYGRRYA